MTMTINSLYLIGSLRNPRVPIIANEIRKICEIEVFDDWYAAGPEADDHWTAHAKGRGELYTVALTNHPAQHVYQYDRKHLERCDAAALLLPAGKSGHLELGFVAGLGKPTFIILDTGFDEQQDRWDVMYNFATAVFYSHATLATYITHLTR